MYVVPFWYYGHSTTLAPVCQVVPNKFVNSAKMRLDIFSHIVVQYQYGGETMNEVNFNLRIPEELNEQLILIAKEEGRSKNKEIEYILKEYVSEYKKKKD